jgi:hypothetical protein
MSLTATMTAFVCTEASLARLGRRDVPISPGTTLRSSYMNNELASLTRPIKLVLWSAMILFTIAVGLVIVTALGMVLKDYKMEGTHWRPAEHAYHPQLGWTGRPNYQNDRNIHPGFPFELSVRINSAGFRDAEWAEKASNSADRVLVVGDSFIYGWASYDGDLFPQIAEEMARLGGRQAAFFNGGMNGYGFHHYHRLIQFLADEIRPSEIWVMLTSNDVGDTALPYDHRYLQRVYKPFFYETGRLADETVPRRLSLKFSDTILGAWPGWLALDELLYLAQDIHYISVGLPTRYTSPLNILRFDELVDNGATLETFPAIGRMVRQNIEDIIKLAEEKRFSVRFINNYTVKTHDRYFTNIERYYDPGVPMLLDLIPWLGHINEGHPNYLWATILAAHVQKFALDDDRIRQIIAQRLPARLDFESRVPASRALSGNNWGLTSEQKLYLKAGQPGYLKLYLGDHFPLAGRLVLRLKTKYAIDPSVIRVSEFGEPCELFEKHQPPTIEFRFDCTSNFAALPYLGLFRIDVTQDLLFDSAEIETSAKN